MIATLTLATSFADANFTPEQIESYEYTPWGVLLTSASKNNLLYTAREFDFEIGLYHQKNSYYNPNLGGIGRFGINNFYSFSLINNFNNFISNIDYNYIDFFKANRVITNSTKYDFRVCVHWFDCWICYLYDDETGK